MQLPDPPTFDFESEAWLQAAEAYRESDQYVGDAIEWAHEWAHEHPALLDAITTHYEGTQREADVIDDIMDGEVVL